MIIWLKSSLIFAGSVSAKSPTTAPQSFAWPLWAENDPAHKFLSEFCGYGAITIARILNRNSIQA